MNGIYKYKTRTSDAAGFCEKVGEFKPCNNVRLGVTVCM